jgi:hypothetical protein
MKTLLNFKILLCLILLGTNSFAENLKIDCGNSWWNVVIDTNKANKIFVPRVGDVIFKVDANRILKWSSDFNEGTIDILSGRARVTKDNYNGDLLGEQFNCNISSSHKKYN